MTLNEFLQHHRLIENPFRGEEARTDAVFARMGHNQPAERVATPTSRSFELHHSDFEKIVGDLRRPSASVVFGEKGSGKTAIRLQITRRVHEHNAQHPNEKVLLISYDDLNGVLGPLHEFHGSKSPLETVQKIRLVDHIDALLHNAVVRLVDALLGKPADSLAFDLGADPRKAVRKLSLRQRQELLLLQALYDRPTVADSRTRELRSRLRIGPPWGAILTNAVALFGLAAVGAAAVYGLFFAPARFKPEWAWWVLAGITAACGVLLVKHYAWDRGVLASTARKIRRQLRTLGRGQRSLVRSLLQLSPRLRPAMALPVTDTDETRFQALEMLRRVVLPLGYTGVMVVVDRVDEPTLVNGDPDRMRALVWPMLNNKFLQHPGLGVKLLLPVELRYMLFRESSAFFQEARLDKQSLVERLTWSGAMLFDLCESRLNACREDAAGGPASLLDIFAEDVTRQDLVDTLDQMHQPRDAFKLLYRCVTEHCSNVTRAEEQWRIPKLILDTVRKQEVDRVQALYRGIRPG
ncbi:MAG: hypothetical protein AB7Q00_10225 [Phycisphaerales bacterium]|nr:MAG: hypothetical protein IPK69_13535 [Phycisphaerales bacterium]